MHRKERDGAAYELTTNASHEVLYFESLQVLSFTFVVFSNE